MPGSAKSCYTRTYALTLWVGLIELPKRNSIICLFLTSLRNSIIFWHMQSATCQSNYFHLIDLRTLCQIASAEIGCKAFSGGCENWTLHPKAILATWKMPFTRHLFSTKWTNSPSKCTDTKAPGIGGLQGRKRGLPSSRLPVNRLQIGFTPRSGRLLPTRTTIVASRPLAKKIYNLC